MTEIIRINTRKETGEHQIVHPETNAKAILMPGGETLEDYMIRTDQRIQQLEEQILSKG